MITLTEQCNCGDVIRHNNGGNYHEIVRIKKEDGKLFLQYSDTSEYSFVKFEDWEEVSDEDIEKIVNSKIADGYYKSGNL